MFCVIEVLRHISNPRT